jgi:hypothetical protein
MKKLMWVFLSFVLFFVSGCGTQQPSSSNSSGGNPTLRISTYNDAPPSGVLEQLSWGGAGGGPLGSCEICWGKVRGDQIVFQDFYPHQNIGVLLYRFTGIDVCGNSTAEYVTAFVAQVGSKGHLTIELSGNYDKLFIFEIYDMDTDDMLFGPPILGVYPCP